MKRIKVRSSRIVALSLMLGLSVIVLSVVLARPPVVKAATAITVTSDADSGPGTLRQAIFDASPNDTINFAAGLTTVNLTNGELLIDKNLTISGPGANLLTVQRSFFGIVPNFRVFDVAARTNVTISGLTIAGGNVPGNSGGGIFNSGTLTIASCAISANSANNGGGIRSDPN